ncbi:MAG: propionyl-CoA carboxylase [Alphaproteobacteria bacterium RIFCSPLOWO2_01_FULL_40_26]|nr:MAG: propionyl-CoA carboxylase [Alphaproteobacteria bacterium RIFCSPHIGHO2_02_FULL_40_34]OFW88105.1 MAG: propionyl-CoA carboxylase [Alphaproteobacteria bacterium RIFCSPHIGHO2_01_FULL_40_8]OFW95015.1 MAG: propionyl-CoA carboxylase [Alphaproteobacteria bacterium RIFCSPLOWO2_01_FULL_40_26]OFX10537.1 MAG: propionyl-CoA carboxylase [Alphaproteobacteria bacterium RIFCSPLOWO2_02_FULL_40_19]OFX12098.1 MAG: propionyl-CoA carboxylase [Alphaproteobacteria bacterium RIFCSPLOWO2_12_FULL_40_11]
MHKLLIANRGEIACRIIKTCRKMGIRTVAVYSDADTNSLFVQMADEAINIGHSPSSQSYLNVEKILAAVKKTGATMVHPGYGFLSENRNFASALAKAGVIFVGPSVHSIEMMGDKIQSKKLALEAGVSTVPGHMGVIKDDKEAIKIAEEIGFPVMVKASAGGGGKGMRIVWKKEEMAEAFLSASNEARNSFADDRIFIEKFIENPRHIEIQVLADKQGNIVCLGERECSIQRNNQKVIEEAPSSFVDEETRQKMYEQSKALAAKVRYYSAGTIEYIMDKNRNFYFLEMNTRLQVEHPVTELITGLDLVELMIKIAFGEKLPFRQEDIKLKGWAMESRIYAEDPSRGFLPSSGRINLYIEPEKNEHVRVDSGIYEGGEVSMFYDAMIAKLCSYGHNRNEAIEHMRHALGSFAIGGVSHNISFLETIMKNERFVNGDISTSFIKQEFPAGFSGSELDSQAEEVLIASAMEIFLKNYERNGHMTGQLRNREKQISERWVVIIDDKPYLVSIVDRNDELLVLECDHKEITIKTSWNNGEKLFRAIVNGRNVGVKIRENNNTGSYLLQYSGLDAFITVYSPRIAELSKFMPKIEKNAKPVNMTSPITGKIVRFKVKEGEEIKAGQELVIIEAMKMENSIRTDHDVKIGKIKFKEGETVAIGQVVIEFLREDVLV